MKLAALLCAFAAACCGQPFSQRGFFETSATLYPQNGFNDSGRAVGEALLRYEAFYKPAPHWQFAGAVDARADTHRQVERAWVLSGRDRERQRPAFAVRHLSAAYTQGKLTVEAGKQFVRWGKADVLNPTDRFAPRDFLNVVNTDFLAVPAVRATYGGQSNSIDLVWQPRFTPSRVPLLNQRWANVPEGLLLRDAGAIYPGGSQAGARWNHIGKLAEYSLSFYQGHNHLPLIDAGIDLNPLRVTLRRLYPQMRMYGVDFAVPLPLVTLKGEAAYFTSSTRNADEYALYVIQIERQAGEWFFVGGYAGQAVTNRRSTADFAPDRGLTRAFVARAGYTIDTNRGIAFETAIRQNGRGVWSKLEYSQAFGQHWRATAGFTLIRGNDSDFLGQYRRNSFALLALRYSF